MASRPLDRAELEQALRALSGWALDDGKLHRAFEFRDFRQAFGFMTAVALAAEAMNHHPDWWNSWRTVKVWLVTHAASGITARDVELAREIDRLAAGTAR